MRAVTPKSSSSSIDGQVFTRDERLSTSPRRAAAHIVASMPAGAAIFILSDESRTDANLRSNHRRNFGPQSAHHDEQRKAFLTLAYAPTNELAPGG